MQKSSTNYSVKIITKIHGQNAPCFKIFRLCIKGLKNDSSKTNTTKFSTRCKMHEIQRHLLLIFCRSNSSTSIFVLFYNFQFKHTLTFPGWQWTGRKQRAPTDGNLIVQQSTSTVMFQFFFCTMIELHLHLHLSHLHIYKYGQISSNFFFSFQQNRQVTKQKVCVSSIQKKKKKKKSLLWMLHVATW